MTDTRLVNKQELIEEIKEVLEDMFDDDLTDAHNMLCANDAKQVELNLWEITVVL